MRRKLNAIPLGILLFLLLPVVSLAAPAQNYPLTGTVLEAKAGRAHEHTYKIETQTSIYKLLCYRRALIGFMNAECSVNGKALAAGDEVHLRSDGKMLFLDAGNDKEQVLSILLDEAKFLPSLPTPAGTTGEGAVVLARGRELSNVDVSQSVPRPALPPSASSSPTIPSAPVIVVPSTGGTPVLVTPTGPVAGGVVTGINTTTGQPVVGVATSPISSPSSTTPLFNGAGSSSSEPAWMDVLYLETENHIYQMVCFSWNCAGAGHQLALGDLLVARIAGKWAYVSLASASSQNGKTKESKYRILSVSGTDEAPSSQPL